MSTPTAVTPPSKATADRLASLAPAGGTVLVLDADTDSTSWTVVVEDGSRGLLAALDAELASGDSSALTLVVNAPVGRPSLTSAALITAAHGIVGVAALEAAPEGRRVNSLLIDGDTSAEDIRRALAYLTDDSAAGFTAGATLDLTHASGREGASRHNSQLPVLVTGAAGGLGAAVAEAFNAAERSVILSDLPGAALEAQSERLDAPAIACDVTSEEDVRALAEHPLLADGLSSLQVIHGVGGSGSIVGLAERPREMSLRINGTGAFNVASALLPAITRGKGSIVVLSSQAGLTAEVGNGAYCAAKFAAVSLVESLAASAAPGVRVHTLCPGPIDTPLMRSAFAGMAEAEGITYDEYHASRLSVIPLGRFGSPEHMGSAALLLDSLDATGLVLAPTGAFLLT